MGLGKMLLNEKGNLEDVNEYRLFRTFTALGWGYNTLMLLSVKDCRDYQL